MNISKSDYVLGVKCPNAIWFKKFRKDLQQELNTAVLEHGQNAQQIAKTGHKAERTIYKYLSLAYLSPKIVSDIMDGTAPAVDLQTLFAIPAKHMDFKEQEEEFYSKI